MTKKQLMLMGFCFGIGSVEKIPKAVAEEKVNGEASIVSGL
jgi:hypothetical protein